MQTRKLLRVIVGLSLLLPAAWVGAQAFPSKPVTMLARWDYDALEQRILASQRRRLFAQEALLQGRWTAWDYQPPVDESRRSVRGAVDPNTTATKAKKRFPFVAERAPDHPRDPAATLPVRP